MENMILRLEGDTIYNLWTNGVFYPCMTIHEHYRKFGYEFQMPPAPPPTVKEAMEMALGADNKAQDVDDKFMAFIEGYTEEMEASTDE